MTIHLVELPDGDLGGLPKSRAVLFDKPNANLVLKQESRSSVVAYAVSVTSCAGDEKTGWNYISEGAAVLKHSIYLASKSTHFRYQYKMYAFVHPDAQSCGSKLSELGYEIVVRDIPVPVDEIKGEYLRSHISENGYVVCISFSLLDRCLRTCDEGVAVRKNSSSSKHSLW